MKKKNIIHVAFALLVLIQSSFAFAQEEMDESKVREEQAYTLGTSAYTWGFTMTEIYRVRQLTMRRCIRKRGSISRWNRSCSMCRRFLIAITR